MTEEPELTSRLHGTGESVAFESEQDREDHALGTVVHAAGGRRERVVGLIRERPVVLVAAVVAGFLLGRLLKRAIRARH